MKVVSSVRSYAILNDSSNRDTSLYPLQQDLTMLWDTSVCALSLPEYDTPIIITHCDKNTLTIKVESSMYSIVFDSKTRKPKLQELK